MPGFGKLVSLLFVWYSFCSYVRAYYYKKWILFFRQSATIWDNSVLPSVFSSVVQFLLRQMPHLLVSYCSEEKPEQYIPTHKNYHHSESVCLQSTVQTHTESVPGVPCVQTGASPDSFLLSRAQINCILCIKTVFAYIRPTDQFISEKQLSCYCCLLILT